MQRAFIDIDIGGHREAHERAIAFVSSCNLRYGLSSSVLSELGGSERARLGELYESDPTWASRGRAEWSPAAHGERVEIELFTDAAPTCVANFCALLTGSKGKSKGSGKPLTYKGSIFHRLVPGFMVQGGDFTHGTGAGGESIWGGTFKDDKGALTLKLDARGLLAMSNTGRNTNGSQFFVTLAPAPKLTGKHCVFGRIVQGFAVLDAIEAVRAVDEVPTVQIRIADCGMLS